VPVRPLAVLALVYALVLGTLRVTVAAPERCPPADPAALVGAATRAAEWMVRTQRADGSYLYELSRTGGVVPGYNAVRHAGSTLALYSAAGVERRFLAPADRALEWMLRRLVGRDDWRALPDGGWYPLGGAALMVAALAERRAVTGDDRYDDVLREVGRFLVASQRPDGGFFVAFDPSREDFDRVGTSRYYPGEATWALARLANAFPDEARWREAAVRGGEFIATERDDVEGVEFPPLNDHWGAYAFAEMAQWPLTDAQAGYARSLFGRFHLLIRSQAQRDNGGVYAFTHGLHRRGAAVGTWVEGQAALARLARADGRLADRRGAIDDSARCGAAMLVRRQTVATGDEQLDGAWFAQGATRVDDQQHPISGLLAVAALEGDS
jgi:hypothetical protein